MQHRAPIDRGFFREDQDGVPVFFPWGLPHRGYRIPDEQARKKASRVTSLLMSSVIAIGVWTAHALQTVLESETAGPDEFLAALVAPGGALLLAIAAYAGWASRFVEPLLESSLRISREERLRDAAEFAEPWKIALIGIVLCGLSVLLMGVQPRTWWLGLLGVALGIGLLAWSAILRRALRSGGHSGAFEPRPTKPARHEVPPGAASPQRATRGRTGR